MKFSYDAHEIAKAVDGQILRYHTKKIQSISFDSRQLSKNSLFVPLCGTKQDGHCFINAAIRSGACAVILDPQKANISSLLSGDYSIIAVSDPQRALAQFAAYHRRQLSAKIIGLTGSVGKTTTKQFLHSVFSQAGKTTSTPGNYNNEIGVPMTLLSMSSATDYGIVEMGMSALHEIESLSRWASPDMAIITNIGTSHIESLGSRENIARAKLEICLGLRPGGTVLIYGDEPLLFGIPNSITIGKKNPNADYLLENYRMTDCGSAFSIRQGNHVQEVTLSVPGLHMAMDAAFAYAAGREFGLSVSQILTGLQAYQGAAMRQQIHRYFDIQVIEDCYNASKESMCAALTLLAELKKKDHCRTVAILGDILEAGSYAELFHRQVGAHCAKMKIDVLFTFGEKSSYLSETVKKMSHHTKVMHFSGDDFALFAHSVTELLLPNDLILLKGSRGMHLERLLPFFQKRGDSSHE